MVGLGPTKMACACPVDDLHMPALGFTVFVRVKTNGTFMSCIPRPMTEYGLVSSLFNILHAGRLQTADLQRQILAQQM